MSELRNKINRITQQIWNERSYKNLIHLNNQKKRILNCIEDEEKRKEEYFEDKAKNQKKAKISIPFASQDEIIKFHEDLVNKTDLIYESELSAPSKMENKDLIEKLHSERAIILAELEKIKNENLRSENIGINFKFCCVIKELGYEIANLFITKSYDDYLLLNKW